MLPLRSFLKTDAAVVLAGAILIATLAVFVPDASRAQQGAKVRWAGLDPNAEGNAPVAWGSTEEEARVRATVACSRVSRTCSGSPAVTMHTSDVFALMCCNKPYLACAAAAAASKPEALRSAEEIFVAGGYSDCALRHYIAASTGAVEKDAPVSKRRRRR